MLSHRLKMGILFQTERRFLGADDKAGLAAILEAIRINTRRNNVQHGDIQFIITAGEESGLVGAKALRSLPNPCEIWLCT